MYISALYFLFAPGSYTSHWLMFFVVNTTGNKAYLILSYVVRCNVAHSLFYIILHIFFVVLYYVTHTLLCFVMLHMSFCASLCCNVLLCFVMLHTFCYAYVACVVLCFVVSYIFFIVLRNAAHVFVVLHCDEHVFVVPCGLIQDKEHVLTRCQIVQHLRNGHRKLTFKWRFQTNPEDLGVLPVNSILWIIHPSPKVMANFFQTQKLSWYPHQICTIFGGCIKCMQVVISFAKYSDFLH